MHALDIYASRLTKFDPLLFAFINIIDAMPEQVYLYEPTIYNNITQSPLLLPPKDAKLPAFLYHIAQKEGIPKDIGPNAKLYPYRGKGMLTVEAVVWIKEETAATCKPVVIEGLCKHPNGLDATGLILNSKMKSTTNTLLAAIVAGLDMETVRTTRSGVDKPTCSVFTECFGFQVYGGSITRNFANKNGLWCTGITFQLICNDNILDQCNDCAIMPDRKKLSLKALEDKWGFPLKK